MSTIFVVGIGPGAYEKMTIEAADALRNCDVIIGYTVYVDLVKEHFAGKEFLTTPMRKEVERCRLAFETAAEGKQVAMICSGDAGVYGMAGLMYELSEEWPDIEIKVIPGVTAATGGAAVLGAPLIHDFALISLSDLLTPWEKIEKRLLLASEADFVICLYNPGSHKRADYLEKACDLMLRYNRLRNRKPDRKRRGDEPDHDACRTSQYKSGYVYDGIYRKQSDKGNPGSHGNAEGISL